MPTYQNGKIYMIESMSANLRYYGSTTQPLYKRFSRHRYDFKSWLERPDEKITTSFFVIEHTDARIILVENVACQSREELVAREAFYIRNNKCVNKVVPDRKPQESRRNYYIQNKPVILQKATTYREEKRQVINTKANDYYKNNSDIIKLKNSLYREEHKEEVKEISRLYREKNREKRSAKNKERIMCECGVEVSIASKSRHKKSRIHLNYIQGQNI